jgi:hypothetical protein
LCDYSQWILLMRFGVWDYRRWHWINGKDSRDIKKARVQENYARISDWVLCLRMLCKAKIFHDE